MSRGQANLLRAFAIWTIYVWVTRIWNILGDDQQGTGFKVVHSVIAVISVAFAIAALVVVSRVRRKRIAAEADRTPTPVGLVLGRGGRRRVRGRQAAGATRVRGRHWRPSAVDVTKTFAR